MRREDGWAEGFVLRFMMALLGGCSWKYIAGISRRQIGQVGP